MAAWPKLPEAVKAGIVAMVKAAAGKDGWSVTCKKGGAEAGPVYKAAEARHVRHRQRLDEPNPPPKRLPMREERVALRALLDLPSSERG